MNFRLLRRPTILEALLVKSQFSEAKRCIELVALILLSISCNVAAPRCFTFPSRLTQFYSSTVNTDTCFIISDTPSLLRNATATGICFQLAEICLVHSGKLNKL
jgi:hypothetical protein